MLSIPDGIKFFFHAGETNWYGTTSDENLVCLFIWLIKYIWIINNIIFKKQIDAILLGTERIGHGFALAKHPSLLEMVKDRNILIEVNPISNQVLKLVEDYRNHPCSIYFSDNYPVVISSDDPSFWEAYPLTHDFYEAFLGMAARWQDLKLLKKLALNSINYSAMNDEEKSIALDKWTKQWTLFIEQLIDDGETGNAKSIWLSTMSSVMMASIACFVVLSSLL